jgi:alpha-1,3-glucosyltransferase
VTSLKRQAEVKPLPSSWHLARTCVILAFPIVPRLPCSPPTYLPHRTRQSPTIWRASPLDPVHRCTLRPTTMNALDRADGSNPNRHHKSSSGYSPSSSRYYRPRLVEEEEASAVAPAGRNDTTRQQDSDIQEDYLSPLVSTSRKSRLRVDSVSSRGSSVAPAALPVYPMRNHSSSRYQNRGGESHLASTSAATGSAEGGLEAWLQSQSIPSNGGSNQDSFASFAPSSRIRRMDAVDEMEMGSDAGRSIGARSAGPKINGKSSGRSNRELQKRLAIPEWDAAALDGDAAGLGGPEAQQLDNVLRWRKDSMARSATRERNDLSDLDHISPETRRRRREGAGSFSASGLSVLREGVRRPRKPNAEPSLDALLSTSMVGHDGAKLPSSRSFSGNLLAAGSSLNGARENSLSQRERERSDEVPFASPLRSFVRWFFLEGLGSTTSRGGVNADGGMVWMTLISVLVSILFKWITGLGSWSGKGSPPMYGDFEAQRHWMEITLHLPRSQWYHYDLQYWGLDYPPLTALVSQWCAQVGSVIPGLSPSLALDTSRGNEDPLLVIFMRASVLVLDLLVYTPAVLFFLSRKLQGRGRRTRAIASISVLLQPATILIDYGHFQYNTIMLGLSATAFAFLYTSLPNPEPSPHASSSVKVSEEGQRRMSSLSRKISYEYMAAAVCFSLSLGFKQMALYFAPAVFAVMLGRCWGLARIKFERG